MQEGHLDGIINGVPEKVTNSLSIPLTPLNKVQNTSQQSDTNYYFYCAEKGR